MIHARPAVVPVLLAALATTLPQPGARAQEAVVLPPEDRPAEPEATEVYTVGALDGEAWETFAGIADVGFDGRGNLYVLDRESGRVVVVDRDGRHLRTAGRQGDGPGEFRQPGAMAVARDGRVVVFDMGHRALLLFGPDGAFVRSVLTDIRDGLPGSTLLAHPSGGVLSASGQGIRIMQRGPGGTVGAPEGVPVLHWRMEDGAAPELIHRAWAPPEPEMSVTGGGSGGVRIGGTAIRAFEPRFFFGVLPGGGVAYVDSLTYRVRVVGADGRLEREVSRGIPPMPVTEAHRQRERERRLAELEEGEGPQVVARMQGPGGATGAVPQGAVREMMEERIRAMRFADRHPVVRRMAVDWNGWIWLERTGPDPLDDGPVDVFTTAGHYVGTIPADGLRIPDAFGPGGLVAYVERDELDVPRVVVRQLPEGWY